MSIKVEQGMLQSDFNKSNYMTKPQQEENTEENYFLKMRAEDEEHKRALQENNYIYRLTLRAKDGDCNAIKKLLSYNPVSFDTTNPIASKLLDEAKEMLSTAIGEYTDNAGKLSDYAINAARAQIENNSYGEKTDYERAQEFQNLLSDMAGGYYSI